MESPKATFRLSAAWLGVTRRCGRKTRTSQKYRKNRDRPCQMTCLNNDPPAPKHTNSQPSLRVQSNGPEPSLLMPPFKSGCIAAIRHEQPDAADVCLTSSGAFD
jgi:hypothetical protein